MKCQCGFEADKNKFIALSRDEKCLSHFPEVAKDTFFELIMPGKNVNGFSRLFACPKCGTVKIELPL